MHLVASVSATLILRHASLALRRSHGPHLSLGAFAKHLSSHRHRHRPMTTIPSPSPAPNLNPHTASSRSTKKARRESPESLLKHRLDQCSKRGDLQEALRLYDEARLQSVPLCIHHYNVLLYLCSTDAGLGVDRGFEIFDQLRDDARVEPNEATFTSAARLAAARRDPRLALDLVRQMSLSGIPPRLRSYGPALFGFCSNSDVQGAQEVEAHMATSGVSPEEPELAALLRLNSDARRGDDVYRVLHKIRTLVRRVTESTAEAVEEWFGSEAAEEVGRGEWDEEEVRDGVVKGGGGWHGKGWLGKGRWTLGRSEMDGKGFCKRCGERLVCIDIDPKETGEFATSLAALACQREARADFVSFQEWLGHNGPFDAVIDGANVGLNNQHNFSFLQLRSVVNGMRERSPSKKMPLIILHSRRVQGGSADNPNNKKLINSWRKSGILYATPPGSNDDWYWLYAAISCRSLIVTNDEMRDHLFELLGTSFFPRWKEKHQVRLTFSRSGLTFHMPPPYSVVVQESERGTWHIPTVTGDDIEAPRQWVCATRGDTVESSLSHAEFGTMNL